MDGAGSWLRLWTFELNSTNTNTTTVVNSGQSSYTYGANVPLTATVAPTNGGGWVTFYANGAPIAACDPVGLTHAGSAYTATCTTTSLTPGATRIMAYYSGDNGYSTSDGSAKLTVQSPPNADYTWSGGASQNSDWSTGANWVGGVAPYGVAQTLTFPNIASNCSTGCSTWNDLAGLTAAGLVIDSNSGYQIEGNSLSLGTAGLTVDNPSGNGTPSSFWLPITLNAGQTWTIDEGPIPFNNFVSGNQNLTVNFNAGSVEPYAGLEVGNITATGTGGFYLDDAMAVNSADGNSTLLENGAGIEADSHSNSVGPLTIGSGGWVSVGGVDNGAGTLTVNGSATFSSGSEFDAAVESSGTAAGSDYSQLTATGNIDLTGAQLNVALVILGGCP